MNSITSGISFPMKLAQARICPRFTQPCRVAPPLQAELLAHDLDQLASSVQVHALCSSLPWTPRGIATSHFGKRAALQVSLERWRRNSDNREKHRSRLDLWLLGYRRSRVEHALPVLLPRG